MNNCKINFNQQENKLAYGIYQDLTGLGVSCKDMDEGYNVTNYAGIHCPDKDAKACVKGNDDGVVEAEEVLEYALDNYDQYRQVMEKKLGGHLPWVLKYALNHEKFRQVIEGRLGEPLPWVLDDLISATTDDLDIRRKVQGVINELNRIVKKNGINEGSEEYKTALATGLFWFVTVPNKDNVEMFPYWKNWKRMVYELENSGLVDFAGYLMSNGGLRVEDDYQEEYTALEALRKRKGECTERSKILFAVFKIAGLKPMFIDEDLLKEETEDPIIKKAIEDLQRTGRGTAHTCIGIHSGGRLRILDPSFTNPDADYKHYTPLSLRQYLSSDYADCGVAWRNKNELDKAMAIYTKAIEIDPRNANAYYNLSVAWIVKGELCIDKALSDLTKALEIDPKLAPAYKNRSIIWAVKGKWNNAIVDFSQFLKLTNTDPQSAFNTLSTSLSIYWQSDKNKPVARQFFNDTETNIANTEACFILSYSLWMAGDKNQFVAVFSMIAESMLEFKKPPAPSTKKFLSEMLKLMPVEMKKDDEIKKSVESIKKKVGL